MERSHQPLITKLQSRSYRWTEHLENCIEKFEKTKTNFAENKNYLLMRKHLVSAKSLRSQVVKGARWMPWHLEPKKGVVSNETPRGAANWL